MIMLKKVLLMIAVCLLVPVLGTAKTFTVVIDAGHGGKDAGACGHVSKEKNLTLRYALAFGKILEQNCPDVKVIYTRKTDRFLELWQRAEIANKNKADLFISVHINSMPGGKAAHGYQTYVLGRSRRDGNKRGYIENLEVAKRENSVILIEDNYRQHYAGFDPNSPESNILFELIQDKNMENSIALAKYMQQHICSNAQRKDMGVHQDNLAVLRLTSMPACLMELGFISSSDEESFMNSDRAVSLYSRGFYNAFVAYKKKVAPGVPYRPIRESADEQEGKSRPAPQPAQPEKPAQPEMPASPEKPVSPEKPASLEKPVSPEKPAQQSLSAPIFKVQIMASDVRLKPNSPLLKGCKDVDSYQENRLYKYTVGASTDYNEIYRLRKTLLTKFPEAFIIAFRDGEKMDVVAAIREYKASKNRK